MLNFELNRAESILIVKPIGPLESTDFEKLVQEVDPYIREQGKLNGLMIYAKSFPGWANFAAFLTHCCNASLVSRSISSSANLEINRMPEVKLSGN